MTTISPASAGAILVTGAYGLIGHAVVALLRARGRVVLATDQLEARPADAAFSALPLTVGGVETMAAFLRAHEIATIVHAAGISGPMLARDQPHTVFTVNAGGTLDLCEAARRAGAPRIVLLSSAAVYGKTGHEMIHETAPLRSTDAYGASKICAEAIAQAYAAGHGVETVILRPSWVYGPRRRTDCVIRTMIVDASAGRPTHLTYGKSFPRQFIHVDDVAAAVASAIDSSGLSGRAFNLADGTRPTLDQVAEIIRSNMSRAQIVLDDGDAPDDAHCGPLDLTAANAHLGWRPQISLEQGVRSYIEYLRNLAASASAAATLEERVRVLP